MPLYEYQCDKCGTVFEIRQKFADDPLTVHENCGGAVHRLISAPALQFKGTGWYITDYGSKHNSPGSNGSSKAEKSEKSENKSSGTPAKTDSGSSTSSSSSSTDKK